MKELASDSPSLNTYSSKVENILCSLQPDSIPDTNLVAKRSGLSLRTLQRKLAEEGTSLSELIDQWRFTQAVQLFVNTEVKVKDVYGQLGYANASSFVRAFRRWTGVSPNRYREKYH